MTGGAVKAIAPCEDARQLRAYVAAQSKDDHAAAYGVERQLQVRLGRQGAALATSLAGPVDSAVFSVQQQECIIETGNTARVSGWDRNRCE